MAHTRRAQVERFYRENKDSILKTARRLDPECGEDLAQAVLEIWLRPTYTPQLTFMAFVRQMELLIYRDGHYQQSKRHGKRRYIPVPQEVHGDVDRMWRRRHGRRTAVKGGAE